MKRYWKILSINIVNTYRRDIAYFGNNWTSTLSTFFFIVAQILFIEFLFTNVNQIGDFSKNDIYFLTLISQLTFFLQSNISFWGAVGLADDVNKGSFDFALTRPVPQRWYMYTKSISVLNTVRDSLPSIIPIIIIINFSELSIELPNLLAGITIFFMGLVIDHMLIYCLGMTAFWSGSSDFTLNYFWAERNQTKIPFENLFTSFKGMIFVLFPAFIASALSTSVMLGYSDAVLWLIITFVAMCAWLMFGNIIWRKALMQYSSASS